MRVTRDVNEDVGVFASNCNFLNLSDHLGILREHNNVISTNLMSGMSAPVPPIGFGSPHSCPVTVSRAALPFRTEKRNDVSTPWCFTYFNLTNSCFTKSGENKIVFCFQNLEFNLEFNFKFTNCLIRFDNSNNNLTGPNYNLNDTSHYQDNIFNESPGFKDINSNEFIIGENSPAINKGSATFASQVPLDILNVDRTSEPDIGAYQHVIFSEE